jgi:hypothetical protein
VQTSVLILESYFDGLEVGIISLFEHRCTAAWRKRVAPYFFDVDSTPLVDRQFLELRYAPY